MNVLYRKGMRYIPGSLPRHHRRWDAASGLSLLEVVVSMIVLTIGVAGVLQVYSSCLQASKTAESYTMAATLAQQAASEIARQTDLTPGLLSGTFADTADDYRWEANIGAEDSTNLIPVRVTVFWPVGALEKRFSMDTYLPPPSAQSTNSTSATSTGGAQ